MSATSSAKIRGFLLSQLPWTGKPEELTDDYPLITSRLLDSLGLMQLVTYVEDEFGVVIEDEELLPESFATITSITALIDSKQRSAGADP